MDARRSQQRLGQLGTRGDDLLAVVQDQQQQPVLDVSRERLAHGVSRAFLDTEDGRHRLRYQTGIGERRQFHQPYSVREVVDHVGSHLQRQSRLADAAHADQRKQPCAAQRPPDFGELAFATDKRRDLLRKIVWRTLKRTQCGVIPAKLRMHDLVNALGVREIAKANGAQVS